MFKRKNEDKEKVLKEKRVRTVRQNTHKLRVVLLWIVLIASFSFAVYKNFTAIDIKTVTKKETVKESVTDTNAIETFTRGFIWNYYAWENTREGLEKWQESLAGYMTEGLQKLNAATFPSGITTSSYVNSVDIWMVEHVGKQEYKVLYSVGQTIVAGKEEEYVWGAYSLRLHVDSADNMVIVQNPAMSKIPSVSDYVPKELVPDSTLVDAQKEVNVFLETFFKMYPTATENELEFYVANDALPSVNMERFQYSKLEQVILNQGKDNMIEATVTVSYVDKVTKVTQFNQFELLLQKGDNWKIIAEGF